jgi:hypothetical protein
MTLRTAPMTEAPAEPMPDPDNLRIDPDQFTGPITIPRV